MSNNLSPIKALEAGYTVVVPNNRAQQIWVQIFSNSSQVKNKVLPSTKIQSFSDFVQGIFKRQIDFFDARILQDQQTLMGLLQQLPHEIPIHNLHVFAQSFIQAYKLMLRWELSSQLLNAYTLNDQQKFFYQQLPYFQAWLEKEKIFTLDAALEAIVHHPQVIWLEQRYFFYGFDDFYPLQESLFKKMHEDGLVIEFEKPINHTTLAVKKYTFVHQEDEFIAALNWLNKQPKTQRAAIIVLEMNREFRQLVERVVMHTHPELARVPLEQVLDKISFSSGLPLYEQPMITELLTLLKTHDQKEAFFMKASVFVAQITYSAHGLRPAFKWNQLLLKALEAAEWCQHIQLSSSEYQAREIFLDKLKLLSHSSSFLADYNYTAWVHSLYVLLKTTLFQPQSLDNQHAFMGLLEASPLALDHLWLIGADYSRIPQSLNPHPLLPIELQERYSMPHAHYQREMHYLKNILSRLAQAEDFTLSYAQYDQNRSLRASPMLESIFPGSYESLPDDLATKPVLPWAHFRAMPSVQHPKRITVAQLNQFLQCPFRGFSRTLKGAQEPIRTTLPIDPARHGQLMHQYIQERLKNDPGNQAMAAYAYHWPLALQRAEQQRLEHMYQQIEQQISGRKDFLLFEYKVSFYSNHWLIEGRADLWDPHEQHVYDIKSKNFTPSAWFSTQPTDCQGSLYVLGLKAQFLSVIKLTQPKVMLVSQETLPYVQDWSEQVRRLLDQWGTGNFEPNPLHGGLCHHCHLKKACRYATL
jgi:CRISPR/Cas system-associated exonuclease Cas4 (RecB family)